MRKKMEWNWEKIDEASYRAKVVGGWVLLHTNHTTVTNGKDKKIVQSESMIFIPDRDHEWTIVAPLVAVASEEKPNKAADFAP